jgi:hypothetical protein
MRRRDPRQSRPGRYVYPFARPCRLRKRLKPLGTSMLRTICIRWRQLLQLLVFVFATLLDLDSLLMLLACTETTLNASLKVIENQHITSQRSVSTAATIRLGPADDEDTLATAFPLLEWPLYLKNIISATNQRNEPTSDERIGTAGQKEV